MASWPRYPGHKNRLVTLPKINDRNASKGYSSIQTDSGNIQADSEEQTLSIKGSGGTTVSAVEGNPDEITITTAIPVADHGGLTGLSDDDHSQYHTDARGDARYAPIAKGVTNGDSHDHSGGDGAQIDHTGLSNLNSTDYTHLTAANHTDLTDGGATTLHKHDHGGMDGLTDDDHTQYFLADGTRSVSGSILPATNNSYDIGSDAYKFKKGYFNDGIIASGIYCLTKPLNLGRKSAVTNKGALMTSEDVLVGGKLEVNGTAYFDGNADIAEGLFFLNSSNGGGFCCNQAINTPDTSLLVAGIRSNGWVMVEYGDRTVDFAHPNQTNPTFFIQSANGTDITQWISFAHNQTDGVIGLGTGNLKITNGSTGYKNVIASVFESIVASGTGPFTVTSPTVVTNLNADKLDGRDASYFAVAGSGVSDHGDLTGLDDNDHTQYYNDSENPIVASGQKLTLNIDPSQFENSTGVLQIKSSFTGGVSAHDELTGLDADDHTQYLLADGTREVQGHLSTDQGVYQEQLLAETSVDIQTATKQTLYTCPIGYQARITQVIMKTSSIELAAISAASLGWAAAATDYATSLDLRNTSDFAILYKVLPYKTGFLRIGVAGDEFGIKLNATEADPGTATFKVFGVLDPV